MPTFSVLLFSPVDTITSESHFYKHVQIIVSKKVPVTTHSMPAKIWLKSEHQQSLQIQTNDCLFFFCKKRNSILLLKLLNVLFHHLHQAKLLHFNETDYKNRLMTVCFGSKYLTIYKCPFICDKHFQSLCPPHADNGKKVSFFMLMAK